MKALVTGATGFVGSNLLEELVTYGFQVRALVRNPAKTKGFEHLPIEWVSGDLSNPESLKSAMEGMSYVFHLAGAIASPDREGYFKANVQGTLNVAEAVVSRAPGLQRFVHVSSLAAAGPASNEDPRIESMKSKPVSAYGESKLESEEQLITKYRDKFPIVIARPPIVYGPQDRATFPFVQAVARNVVPLVQGRTRADHKKFYSLVHVRDLCRGLIQAALAPVDKVPSGEVFFLSGDGIASYEEWFDALADALNRSPVRIKIPYPVIQGLAYAFNAVRKVVPLSFPLTIDKLKEIEPDYWICSNEKAKTALGFSPEFDLQRGMADAVNWYKTNKWI